MAAAISTAVSDLVLAASAVWSFSQLGTRTDIDCQFSKWWFMLQTMAASLGVLKFGRLLENYQEHVDKYHRNFSWLSLALGIPCLGAQFCFLYKFTLLSQVFLGSAVLSLIISTRKPELKEKIPKVVSACVISALIFIGFEGNNINLRWAAFLFILSAVVGDEGTVRILDLPRVDLFHYILVGVNILTVRALLKS